MDTISDNTSGATDDTLRAAFEAAMRDAGWTNVDPGSWFGYRAGYEHGSWCRRVHWADRHHLVRGHDRRSRRAHPEIRGNAMRLNISMVEAELLRDALRYWQSCLREDRMEGEAHRAAGRYVANRCADLLAKIEPLLTDDAGAK